MDVPYRPFRVLSQGTSLPEMRKICLFKILEVVVKRRGAVAFASWNKQKDRVIHILRGGYNILYGCFKRLLHVYSHN